METRAAGRTVVLKPRKQVAEKNKETAELAAQVSVWIGTARAICACTFSLILQNTVILHSTKCCLSSITLGKESLAWCFLGGGQSKVIFCS